MERKDVEAHQLLFFHTGLLQINAEHSLTPEKTPGRKTVICSAFGNQKCPEANSSCEVCGPEEGSSADKMEFVSEKGDSGVTMALSLIPPLAAER